MALAKLASAGEGAKFCDDSFPPSYHALNDPALEDEVTYVYLCRYIYHITSYQALNDPALEDEVECWARPEGFGLRYDRTTPGPVL